VVRRDSRWPDFAIIATAFGHSLTLPDSLGRVRELLGDILVMLNEYPYWFIVALMVSAVGFAATPLALAWVWAKKFSPRKPGPEKNAIYECGLESKGDAWVQFKAEYYLYAIIFLIFDVETIFLLPFAVAFAGLSGGAFLAMMVFLLLLVEGLVWAWQKGVLTWK
jgi:NADH:ubiquinone oxidoreductase subunit 3 (subunit A)